MTNVVREWFAEKEVEFAPCPPHLKGRANIIEAFWRPLLIAMRKMMGDQDVSKFYFPTCAVKATETEMMLPTRRNPGCCSPYVAWHRKRPFGGHLRVWGSKCVVKDFKRKDKFVQQAHDARLMGDGESSAWRVMLNKDREIVKSAHVRFDERSASQRIIDGELARHAAVGDPVPGDGETDRSLVNRLLATPRGVIPQATLDAAVAAAVPALEGEQRASSDNGVPVLVDTNNKSPKRGYELI